MSEERPRINTDNTDKTVNVIRKIDTARLDEVAGNPRLRSEEIPKHFGMGRSAFFHALTSNDVLWGIYRKARRRAGFKVRTEERLRPKSLAVLDGDEIKIVDAIEAGASRLSEVRAAAIASGVEPLRFPSILYNLEHEKHAIWSRESGMPPVTRYFLREEEILESGVRGRESGTDGGNPTVREGAKESAVEPAHSKIKEAA